MCSHLSTPFWAVRVLRGSENGLHECSEVTVNGKVSSQRLLQDVLPSGRRVEIDRMGDSVLVRVGSAVAVVPVRGFPLFGRPLSERIREAVVRLDASEDGDGIEHDEVQAAARDALHRGGKLEEYGSSVRRKPPLVFRPPPDPPPPSER